MQSLLKPTERSSDPEATSGTDAEDTFETIAYNWNSNRSQSSRQFAGPSKLSGVGHLSGLGEERTSSGGRLSGLGTAGSSSLGASASAPLAPGGFSGAGRLGRSSTYCPSQATAITRENSSAEECVLAYKQARPPLLRPVGWVC